MLINAILIKFHLKESFSSYRITLKGKSENIYTVDVIGFILVFDYYLLNVALQTYFYRFTSLFPCNKLIEAFKYLKFLLKLVSFRFTLLFTVYEILLLKL